MSASSTETSGEANGSTRSTATRVLPAVGGGGRVGPLSMLVGGALLAWAIKTGRNRRGRAALLGLSSIALLGLGLRRWRRDRRASGIETEADVHRDEDDHKQVSDEAHVERDRDLGAHRNAVESGSVYQAETEPNPRGMTDRSDVQADEGGDIEFVEGKEPSEHGETHLPDEDARDSRVDTGADEPTEVDLSEAAMADETSEAVGPHPEQAYPTQEGTDPEPNAEEAPERAGEGAVAPAGSNADADDEERDTGDESADAADDPDR